MSYAGTKDVKVQPQPLILKEDDKIPLFLIKLWNIVEDPSYYEVIRWDESGYSFHILDPYSFCRNVLPQYFKHNNLNSLIRQLNMCKIIVLLSIILDGFRKMTPIERTSLARAESDQDHLEFSHPCFVRDHPELLVNIKRKAPTARHNNNDGTVSVPAKDLTSVFEELRTLRDRQKQMESRMSDLVKENELIWQEMGHMRGAHVKQQQIVTKLVQFMVAMLQPSKRLGKRRILAIDETQPKKSRIAGEIPLQAIQQSNVAEVLDGLMREYAIPNPNSFRNINQQNSALRPSNGPIIADVTDEMDHLGPPSGQKMGMSCSAVPLYQQEQYSNPQQSRIPPNTAPMSAATTVPISSTRANAPSTSQIPPAVMLQGQIGQSQTSPAVDSSTASPTSNLIEVPLVNPPCSSEHPLITSPASANLNLSTAEFAEYLNSVDQSIDNCRDLIGGHWDDLDLDGLLDFDQKDTTVNSPTNSKPGSVNRHPTYGPFDSAPY